MNWKVLWVQVVKEAPPGLDLPLHATHLKRLTDQHLSNLRNCPPRPYQVCEEYRSLHMELSLAAK